MEDQAVQYETVSVRTEGEDEELLGYRLLNGEYKGAVFVIHDVQLEDPGESEDEEASLLINFDVVDGVDVGEGGEVPGELEELIAAVACDLMSQADEEDI